MKNNHTIPLLEQELILAHILQKSREYILTHPETPLNKAQKAKFKSFINRRKNHEPLAYILGHKEFYGLDFKVDKNTLVPRPETELLVEGVIKLSPKNTNIIDVGTGSGNIIISIAHNIERIAHNKIKFFAIDISAKALSIAKYNARKNKVDKKIEFIKSDLLKNKKLLNKIKDENLIIIANLPYLSEKIYEHTLPDVKNFEPKSALLSGAYGLDHYEKLLAQIEILKINCSMLHISCFLEISPEQKIKIEKLARKYFSECKINFIKDLSGRWRVAKLEL